MEQVFFSPKADPMKKVYIAHPLRGTEVSIENTAKNMTRADAICKRLAAQHPNVLILSPIHAFGFISPLGPQGWVLEQCQKLLSLADELWVFGSHEDSEGCRMEIEQARNLGKTIVYEDGRVEGGSSDAQCA